MTPIVLRVGDSAVAEYVTEPEGDPTLLPRPYLQPIRTIAGTVVTDVSRPFARLPPTTTSPTRSAASA